MLRVSIAGPHVAPVEVEELGHLVELDEVDVVEFEIDDSVGA